jgi:hypothetical protein
VISYSNKSLSSPAYFPFFGFFRNQISAFLKTVLTKMINTVAAANSECSSCGGSSQYAYDKFRQSHDHDL